MQFHVHLQIKALTYLTNVEDEFREVMPLKPIDTHAASDRIYHTFGCIVALCTYGT